MNKLLWANSLLNKFVGIALIAGNLYWTYYHLNLFYLYHFTSLLFVVKVPDIILLFNGVLGICGVFIGIAIFRGYLPAIKWSIINFCILLAGFLLEAISII